MESSTTATSIFQFLTHPNPAVVQDRTGYKPNTSSKRYLTPQRLKRWSEFDDLKCLQDIFKGSLLQEACREGRNLPQYPTICSETDLDVEEEPATVSMINKWTRSVVTSALQPVKHLFNPVIWKPGRRQVARQVSPGSSPTGVRKQPPRANSKKTRKQETLSLSRLYPDSGSVSPGSDVEKFLKEYKSASAWTSEDFFAQDPVDDQGNWINQAHKKQWAMPIRQAYSYCVKHMCRYGCILSCNEVFIFRIKPIDRLSVKKKGPADPEDLLLSSVSKNGMMEYASIPWSNHCDGTEEIPDGKWTVNLVLWFLHILAGNEHHIDWEYELLSAQQLSRQSREDEESSSPEPEKEALQPDDPCIDHSDADNSQDGQDVVQGDGEDEVLVRSKRKRKRRGEAEDGEEDESDDGPNYSFFKRSFSAG